MTHPYEPVPGPPESSSGPWVPAGYAAGYSPYGAYGTGRPPGRRVPNPAGIVLALLGGAAALVGVFDDWYTDVKLGDIINALDVHGAKAFPKAYFGWLMWVLLAATVVSALLASVPNPAATALRVVSPILGVAGAALVVSSLNELISKGRSSTTARAACTSCSAGSSSPAPPARSARGAATTEHLPSRPVDWDPHCEMLVVTIIVV